MEKKNIETPFIGIDVIDGDIKTSSPTELVGTKFSIIISSKIKFVDRLLNLLFNPFRYLIYGVIKY